MNNRLKKIRKGLGLVAGLTAAVLLYAFVRMLVLNNRTYELKLDIFQVNQLAKIYERIENAVGPAHLRLVAGDSQAAVSELRRSWPPLCAGEFEPRLYTMLAREVLTDLSERAQLQMEDKVSSILYASVSATEIVSYFILAGLVAGWVSIRRVHSSAPDITVTC